MEEAPLFLPEGGYEVAMGGSGDAVGDGRHHGSPIAHEEGIDREMQAGERGALDDFTAGERHFDPAALVTAQPDGGLGGGIPEDVFEHAEGLEERPAAIDLGLLLGAVGVENEIRRSAEVTIPGGLALLVDAAVHLRDEPRHEDGRFVQSHLRMHADKQAGRVEAVVVHTSGHVRQGGRLHHIEVEHHRDGSATKLVRTQSRQMDSPLPQQAEYDSSLAPDRRGQATIFDNSPHRKLHPLPLPSRPS